MHNPFSPFLNLRNLPQSSKRRPHSSGSRCRHSVCSSSDGLAAGLAVPDANGVSLNGGLAAESADISGVLGDFHLLDLLSEGGTVSGTVFTGHADLLGSLRHLC